MSAVPIVAEGDEAFSDVSEPDEPNQPGVVLNGKVRYGRRKEYEARKKVQDEEAKERTREAFRKREEELKQIEAERMERHAEGDISDEEVGLSDSSCEEVVPMKRSLVSEVSIETHLVADDEYCENLPAGMMSPLTPSAHRKESKKSSLKVSSPQPDDEGRQGSKRTLKRVSFNGDMEPFAEQAKKNAEQAVNETLRSAELRTQLDE